MHPRALRIAPFLFGSGFCALVYQTAWQRELRLVFGASTAASAAVLAIFMAGLGIGSVLLGKRADQHKRPLELYGNLEGLISLSAAVTPALLWVLRQIYIALGGTVSLGLVGGTILRLVLAAVLLGVPTVLMGGTLPAAARAASSPDDVRRRGLAVLYGVNTLGAVAGAAASTFFLFEVFGTELTLWLACLLNGLIAILARVESRSLPEVPPEAPAAAAATESAPSTPAAEGPATPPFFALGAAATVGFVFFLMELVWYRMLGPLLGGSTFTFGLILAMVLLGIGLGGAAYSTWGQNRPATLKGFALTCTLEALFIALPFALGDSVAVVTVMLRQLTTFGFYGQVLGWGVIAALVMLPAAFISGVQFPLLLALLGKGRESVGKQVGQAYAWNTTGSILGSLAGGFGLMPLLTAPGVWRLVVGLLVALGVVAAVLSMRAERGPRGLLLPTVAGVLALMMVSSLGPTAAWRHSPIGAGRFAFKSTQANERAMWINATNGRTVWEAEGLESSVGLLAYDGISFYVNGKSDGSALGDAGTQVMGGLTGALLHPNPRSAFVVGLGTGSSSGWLAKLPDMERVDVVEIEPAILEVARQCKDVNAGAMDNPKMHTIIGDAREVLLATKSSYDLIISEPSNPYRAGISTLFTREFYQAVKERMAPGGIFVQWLQGYEIDAQTMKSVYATLTREFAAVETWQTYGPDLLLVATREPLTHDISRLRERLGQETYREALGKTWFVNELEGVTAHFVGGTALAQMLAKDSEHLINTDDLSYMEFGIARTAGRTGSLDLMDLRVGAYQARAERPTITGGTVDWDREFLLRYYAGLPRFATPEEIQRRSPLMRQKAEFQQHLLQRNLTAIVNSWRKSPWEPQGIQELSGLGLALASAGEEAAASMAEQLRPYLPMEADTILARLRLRQGKLTEATEALERAFTRLKAEPWGSSDARALLLQNALFVAEKEPSLGRRLFPLMEKPFSTHAIEIDRRKSLVRMAKLIDWQNLCQRAIKPLEPHVDWERGFLQDRLLCYDTTRDPLREQALADLDRFLSEEPVKLLDGDVLEGLTQPGQEVPSAAEDVKPRPSAAEGLR
ncbi:fused MFS/spermidine synthase [Myxococcaceae bacterium GXIMD 01537]